jgi:hypothetical protein
MAHEPEKRSWTRRRDEVLDLLDKSELGQVVADTALAADSSMLLTVT